MAEGNRCILPSGVPGLSVAYERVQEQYNPHFPENLTADHVASAKLDTSLGTVLHAVHDKKMACDKVDGIFMKMRC